MWFKCGADMMNNVVMRDLSKPIMERDNYIKSRKFVFLFLLSETAEDRADDLQDAADLARLVDTTPKQAQIVWDVCIKHGVLRKGPNGYSAKQWMIERGILGDTRKWQRGETQGQNGHSWQQSKNIFGG